MDNTYKVLSTIDDIISRTYQFEKLTLASNDPKDIGTSKTYWVCFTEPSNSYELELIPHLPKPLEDEPQIKSIFADTISSSPSSPLYKLDPVKDLARRKKNHDRLVTSLLEIQEARLQDPFLAFLEPPGPGPEPQLDVQSCLAKTGEMVTKISLRDGRFPPKPKSNQKPRTVPDTFIQVLFGFRAVLLVLLDVSSRLCHDKYGSLDTTYIGESKPICCFDALDKMSSWSITDFVPNMKYWKDRPLASFLQNDLPPCPSSWTHHPEDTLFSGRIGEFYRRLSTPCRIENMYGSQLFRASFSLAQAKKGCHPVPDSFLTAAYVKHAKVLSEPVLDVDYPELRPFLKVFFRNFNPANLLRSLLTREASTSASNTNTRARGGAREDVRTFYSTRLDTSTNGLIRMVESSKGVVEERGLLPPSLPELVDLVSRPIIRDYSSLSSRTLSHIPVDKRDIPFSVVRGITEPLKVRSITAMSALSSHFSGPLQTQLWTYLNTFPQFRLTSQTISHDHISWLLSAQENLFPEPSEKLNFNSGDYSSATDRIHLKATQIVLDEIKHRIDSPHNMTRAEDVLLFKHFDEILSPQWLIYPPETHVDPFVQKNGQLMGSRLSFPILCILNFWTYFRSLPDPLRSRILAGRLSLKSLPVLINGDDILFKCTKVQWENWRSAGKLIGLELSVGKNFTHPNYLTINSVPIAVQEFDYKVTRIPPLLDKKTLSWADMDELYTTQPQEYNRLYEARTLPVLPSIEVMSTINVGLLIGLSKTAKGVRDDDLPLSGWFDGAVLGSFDPEQAAKWFLHYHRDEIRRQTRFGSVVLNLFAHPLLGGLGFTRPAGFEVHYTQQQRHLAYRLLQGILSLQDKFLVPEDSPIESFHFLESAKTNRPSLGYKLGRDLFSLGPRIGPLLKNQERGMSDRRIYDTILSQSMIKDSDSEGLTVKTRLSNSELKFILKSANNFREKVLDLTDLETFPLTPVINYSDEDNESTDKLTLVPDLPTSIDSLGETSTTITSPIPVQEDWETITVPPPPQLTRQVAVVHVNEARRESRRIVRERIAQLRRSEYRY